jgi:putative ABC transport system permease protein
VAGITVLTALAAFLPAWRAGRTSTVAAVSGGRAGASDRASRLAALASRMRVPRVVVFGVKDLFARRARAWLTIGAVAVASAAVIATVTMDATFTRVLSDPGMIGVLPTDLELEPAAEGDQRISDEEIVELISTNADVEAHITRRWVSVFIGGEGHAGYGVGGEIDEFEYPLIDGRMFSSRREAIIGLGLARHLGVGVGDKKLVHFGSATGPSRVIEIVGVYIEDANNGRMISFALEDLRRAAPDIDAGDYGLRLRPGSAPSIVSDSLIEQSGGRVVITNVAKELDDAVAEVRDLITPVLVALSVFLLTLVAVNLFSSLMLSVRERSREIGIMKAVGFTPAQVVASIVSGALVLTVIGAVIGAPGGWLFIRVLIHRPFAEQGYDPSELIQPPRVMWLGLLLLTAAVVAALGSAFPARHAAGTSVTEALRYE